MINILFEKEQFVKKVVVSGHAMFADSGKDIVCASVSSIVIFAFNTCIKFDENITYDIDEEAGYLELNITNYDENIEIVLNLLHTMMCELRDQYREYITIIDGGESYDKT